MGCVRSVIERCMRGASDVPAVIEPENHQCADRSSRPDAYAAGRSKSPPGDQIRR